MGCIEPRQKWHRSCDWFWLKVGNWKRAWILWDNKCSFRSLQTNMVKVTPNMWVGSTPAPQSKKRILIQDFPISDSLIGWILCQVAGGRVSLFVPHVLWISMTHSSMIHCLCYLYHRRWWSTQGRLLSLTVARQTRICFSCITNASIIKQNMLLLPTKKWKGKNY